MSAPPQLRSMIVVGGGVIGMNCALSLQARGIAVTVVDPGMLRGASLGNAGHIAVEQVEPLASLATLRSLPRMLYSRGGPVSLMPREIGAWLPFAMRFARAAAPARFRAGKAALSSIAAAAIPAWRRQLERAGAADLLLDHGHYAVWETERAAEAGRRSWAAADTGAVTVREASRDELARIEAQLSVRLAGGVRFDGSAQIAGLDLLAAALVRSFERSGGVRVRGAAAEVSAGAVTLETGERYEADAVLVAAGAASGPLLPRHRVPLIAERGYHLQAAESDWPLDLPPVVFEERSIIVTRFRSGLRAAGFFEFARPEAKPDPRKWARLRSHLSDLGIAFSEPVEWTGARPTLPDYLPAMGRTADGLFYAFGHQHLGLTLAAATGEAIGALAAGDAPRFDLSPFRIERFGRRG
ncbi:MAG TPA: FAD-binding oxidoreductase [Allosphingosinicella sp.]|nr:FAD-binding oxidoreductase [Allosphingosinicella sp.]